MKRMATLLLAAALMLTGCGRARSAASQSGPDPAPTAAEDTRGTLRLYDAVNLPGLEAAAHLYGDSRGIAIVWAEQAADADLWALDNQPGEGCQVLSDTPLLAALQERAGVGEHFTGLPLGTTAYGYWADAAMLESLFPGQDAAAALRTADWTEWSALLDTLRGWLENPAEASVTLSGQTFTLAATKDANTLLLKELFAHAQKQGCAPFGPELLAPVYAAAGEAFSAEAYTGPLNGLWAAFAAEEGFGSYAFADGAAALAAGEVLFCRGTYAALQAGVADAALTARLTYLPFKIGLDETDLDDSARFSLEDLFGWPILEQAGWLCIPESATPEGSSQAQGFLLWLYTSDAGRAALTDTMGLTAQWGAGGSTPGAQLQQQAYADGKSLWSPWFSPELTGQMETLYQDGVQAGLTKAARRAWNSALCSLMT